MSEDLLNRFLRLFVIIAVKTGVMFLFQPRLVVRLTVSNVGEKQFHIDCLFGLSERYILLSAPLHLIGMGVVDILVIEWFPIKHDAMETIFALHQWPK